MKKFIFQVKLARGLSVFFLLIGGIFFTVGLDMVFFHKVIPISQEPGYAFASWFFLMIGGLVGFTGLQNCFSPMTLLAVSKRGVELKASPGPIRKLTLIPWEDIEDIGQGQIIMSGSKGGRIIHQTVKFILKKNTPSAAGRITDAMVRWSETEVNFDSTYFKIDLDVLIKALRKIRENPGNYDELNEEADYFISHNKFD